MEKDLKSKKSSSTKKKSTTSKTTNSVKKIETKVSKKTYNSKKNSISDKKVKEETPKNKPRRKQKMDKGTVVLTIVFIALLILVIVLLIFAINKKRELQHELKARMVFPVVEENSKMAISIDLSEVSEDEDYIFKVTNYRGNVVNKFDINYKITISNNSKVKVKLYRGKGKNDLMKNQKVTEIKDLKLYKNEKEDVYFRISFEGLDKAKEKEMVNVIINS